MRHASVITAFVVAGCSGSLNGSVKAGGTAGIGASTASPAGSAAAKGGAALAPVPDTEPPTYPNGLVAMVGAEPQWFEGPWASEVRNGSVHAALFVNSRPVVFMGTDDKGKPKARKATVKNGAENAEASLLGPNELAFLMAGPGPYMVKTLCYTRGPDGSFVLFGGGLRRRSDLRVVGILRGMDCRPIAAAVATP